MSSDFELQYAIQFGDTTKILEILNQTSPIRKCVILTTNTVITAIRFNQLASVQALIEQGAPVQAEPWVSSQPLDTACDCFPVNYDIVNYLLDKGADPNTIGQGFMTPLIRAIHYRNYKLTKLLLDYAADPNRNPWVNKLPIHTAIYVRSPEIVQLLLDYGANPCVDGTSYEGLFYGNAIKYAQQQGCPEIEQIITNHQSPSKQQGQQGPQEQQGQQGPQGPQELQGPQDLKFTITIEGDRDDIAKLKEKLAYIL